MPYLPVPGLVAQKAAAFRAAGLRGGMFSWTLGGFPSLNWEVAARVLAQPDAEPDTVVRRVAEERFGSAAPTMLKAWSEIEGALSSYPFSLAVIYSSFVHYGPALRLFLTPSGRPAQILNSGDSLQWTQPFGPEKTAALFAEMGRRCSAAVAEVRKSVRGHDRDLGVMEATALHFEAVALLIRYYQLRGKPSPELRANIEEQLRAAQRFSVLVEADSRLGFEAQSGYLYTPLDVREKIAACRYLLRRQSSIEATI